MPINFPSTPTDGQTITHNGKTWTYDSSSTSWNFTPSTFTETDTLSDVLSRGNTTSTDINTTGKVYFANMFATVGDLPSATTYHGMFAHVHATGKGYFAHSDNWIELANASDIPTSTYANSDVDTHLNKDVSSDGKVLSWDQDSGNYSWIDLPSGGSSSVSIDDSAPSSASSGDLWWDSSEGSLKIYYQDDDSSQWVDASHSGSGGSSGSSITAQGFKFDVATTMANGTRTSGSGLNGNLVSPKSGSGKMKLKVFSGDILAGESFTIEFYVNEDSSNILSSLVIDENNYSSVNSISFDVQELDLICFRLTFTGLNTHKSIIGTFEI